MEFINEHVDKGKIGDIVAELHENYGNTKTAEALDNIKELGFNYATKSGITIAISDASIPEDKEEILKRLKKKSGILSNIISEGYYRE